MTNIPDFIERIDNGGTSSFQVHLLMSVYITNKSLVANKKSLINSLQTSRLDQFLSTVHSMSRLKTTSQNFYILFDDDFSNQRNLVLEWLQVLFPRARIYDFRLSSFLDWQEADRNIPHNSQLVLLQTNFDHPYIANEPESFERFCKNLIELGERAIGEITHWPEALANLANPWGDLQRNHKIGEIFVGECKQTIGTCLVTKSLFHEWWEKDFTTGSKIIRPDNPFGPNVTFHKAIYAVPKIELFRHMDGYDLANIVSPWAQSFRPCCSITQQSINHAEWNYGTFNEQQDSKLGTIDLPIMPSEYEVDIEKTYERFPNLILVASAHRINFHVINELKSYYLGSGSGLLSGLYITLFRNKYWRGRLPRFILDQTIGHVLCMIYKAFGAERKLLKESILLSYISSFGWRRMLPKLIKRLLLKLYSWLARQLSPRTRQLIKGLIKVINN